ncbi:hypothetical protein QJQ45_000378 [Haematococcus lacustris]|nr:hypothetical protein QJQ45_000378 [Haematococcus lacustris]
MLMLLSHTTATPVATQAEQHQRQHQLNGDPTTDRTIVPADPALSAQTDRGPKTNPDMLASDQPLDAFRGNTQTLDALSALLSRLADPTCFLAPPPDLSSATRAAAHQELYDHAVRALLVGAAAADRADTLAGLTGVTSARSRGVTTTQALVPELCVGPAFDAEQVWLQLDAATGMALKKARRLVAKASALCPEGREEAGEGQAGAVGIIKPQHEAAIDALLAGEESDSDGQEGEEEEGEEEGEEEEESEGSEDDNRGRGGRQGEPQAGRVEGKKGSGGRGGGKYGFSFDDAGGDEDDEDEDGDGGLEAMLAQRSDSDDLDTHSGSELEEGEGEEDEGQGEEEDEDEDGHFGFRGAAAKAAAQGAGSRLGGDKKGVVGGGKGRQGEEQGRRPGEDGFLRLQEMEAFLEDSERQHSAQLAKQEGSAGHQLLQGWTEGMWHAGRTKPRGQGSRASKDKSGEAVEEDQEEEEEESQCGPMDMALSIMAEHAAVRQLLNAMVSHVVPLSQAIDAMGLAATPGVIKQPELRQLSTLLQEACATLHMAMPVFINVVNTAVLAASVDWEPDCSVAQTVRATPCFYNRPWFDNVALNTEPETFAQLRLLFTAGDMKLAMVRCYQELPPKEQAAHVLSKHGNTRLRSEADSRSLATIHKDGYKEGVFVN